MKKKIQQMQITDIFEYEMLSFENISTHYIMTVNI